jgi:formylglycine-generating enzyme required for sulfatase activity
MRPSPVFALVCCFSFGCQQAESKKLDEPPAPASVAAPTPPAPSASAVSNTPASPYAPNPKGPCDGVADGATACDGNRIVKCQSANATPEAISPCSTLERCEKGACVGACPEGEVFIPPTGPNGFTMGKGSQPFAFGSRASGNGGRGVADAPHKVVLTKPFCIDATEVTSGAYRKCVDEKVCPVAVKPDRWATYKDKPDHPINMVDWNIGKTYCEFMKKSLPTEAQWEWAATGGDGRTWPWGEEDPSCERADFTQAILISPGGDSGCHGGGPSAVATHQKGDKTWPSGAIHDLAGNVWEWTLDSYEPYRGGPETDPLHDNRNIGNRVIRGGGWNRSGKGITTSFRGGAVQTYKVPGLGFRCVRNVDPAAKP